MCCVPCSICLQPISFRTKAPSVLALARKKSLKKKLITLEKDIPGRKDVIYALLCGGLGIVPYVGGTMAELLKVVVSSPAEKRAREQPERVVAVLNQLVEEGITTASLERNEAFQASIASAVENAHRPKGEAYRSAIIQAFFESERAGSDANADVSHLYVQLLEQMTPTHMTVLHAFASQGEGMNAMFESNKQASVVAETTRRRGMGGRNFDLIIVIRSLVALGLLAIDNGADSWIIETGTFRRASATPAGLTLVRWAVDDGWASACHR